MHIFYMEANILYIHALRNALIYIYIHTQKKREKGNQFCCSFGQDSLTGELTMCLILAVWPLTQICA